jgi:hypothetical protein
MIIREEQGCFLGSALFCQVLAGIAVIVTALEIELTNRLLQLKRGPPLQR